MSGKAESPSERLIFCKATDFEVTLEKISCLSWKEEEALICQSSSSFGAEENDSAMCDSI